MYGIPIRGNGVTIANSKFEPTGGMLMQRTVPTYPPASDSFHNQHAMKAGTPVKNAENRIFAISYTGAGYYLTSLAPDKDTFIQLVSMSGTVSFTIKFSLDGVNFVDSGLGSISVPANGSNGIWIEKWSNAYLLIEVTGSGTYYALQG